MSAMCGWCASPVRAAGAMVELAPHYSRTGAAHRLPELCELGRVLWACSDCRERYGEGDPLPVGPAGRDALFGSAAVPWPSGAARRPLKAGFAPPAAPVTGVELAELVGTPSDFVHPLLSWTVHPARDWHAARATPYGPVCACGSGVEPVFVGGWWSESLGWVARCRHCCPAMERRGLTAHQLCWRGGLRCRACGARGARPRDELFTPAAALALEAKRGSLLTACPGPMDARRAAIAAGTGYDVGPCS